MTGPRWMNVMLLLPEAEAMAMLDIMRAIDFTDSTLDPCELVRGDGAKVFYGPCKPPRGYRASPPP